VRTIPYLGYALVILCAGCTDLRPRDFLQKGCILYPSGETRVLYGADDRIKVNIKCALGTGLPEQRP
jgi:hypothetical protein